MSERARRRVVVHGNVQGVFFRDSCRSEASSREWPAGSRTGPTGRSRRCSRASPPAVSAMVDWCSQARAAPTSESVDESSEEPEGLAGFQILTPT